MQRCNDRPCKEMPALCTANGHKSEKNAEVFSNSRVIPIWKLINSENIINTEAGCLQCPVCPELIHYHVNRPPKCDDAGTDLHYLHSWLVPGPFLGLALITRSRFCTFTITLCLGSVSHPAILPFYF